MTTTNNQQQGSIKLNIPKNVDSQTVDVVGQNELQSRRVFVMRKLKFDDSLTDKVCYRKQLIFHKLQTCIFKKSRENNKAMRMTDGHLYLQCRLDFNDFTN